MKKVLLALVLVLGMTTSAYGGVGVVCEVETQAELQGAVDGSVSCIGNEVIVTGDIALASAIEITVMGLDIHGSTGSEVISGDLNAFPVLLIGNDDIAIHDLVLNNTNTNAASYETLVANGTSGIEIYDVEFIKCDQACIYVNGTGTFTAYQNTFTNTTADNAIVYQSGNYSSVTFNNASMTSYTAWQLSATTPNSGADTGDVEFYIDDGGDILPFGSVLTSKTGTFTKAVDFATELPETAFYALFTGPNSTSDFADTGDTYGVDIDWGLDTNWSWGSYTACDKAWFRTGQGTGDYDGDGLTNGDEDADNDCTVDLTETDPAKADTDADGADDDTDNCPVTANADQADEDSDGTGNACDADYIPPTEGGGENSAPSIPELVYPDDGATNVALSFEFLWNASTDGDGDAVTYQLYLCDNENFEGCDPIDVTPAITALNIIYTNKFTQGGSGMLLLLGAIALGGAVSRRRKWILLGISLLSISIFAVSCGGGGSDTTTTTPTGDVNYSVSGLQPNTTYYWKVTATDSNDNVTSTEVRNFTTTAVSEGSQTTL